MRRNLVSPIVILLVVLFIAAVFEGGVQAAQSPLEMVQQALQDRRFDQAIRSLEPMLDQNPRDPNLWLLQGIALSSLGRNADGLAAFREALRWKTDFLPALKATAQIEYGSDDPQTSETLKRILALEPNNPAAHAMLGVLAFEREKCGEAVEHFERSREQTLGNPVAARQFGACLSETGVYSEAVKVFELLLSREPADADLRYNLALSLNQAGEHQKAAEILDPLLESPEPASDVLSLAAAAYEASGQRPQAWSALQKAVKLHPTEPRHYIDLAHICMRQESFELGLRILDAAAQKLPDSQRFHTMRGILQAELGRYEEAEREFEQARNQTDDSTAATTALAMTMEKSGRLDEALELIRKQAKENPEDPVVLRRLAEVLIQRGADPGEPEFEEARLALVRSIESSPNQPNSRTQLARMLLKLGQTAEAIQELQRAVEIDPGSQRASYQLFLSLRKAGRRAEAKELMARFQMLLKQEREEDIKKPRYRLIEKPIPDTR